MLPYLAETLCRNLQSRTIQPRLCVGIYKVVPFSRDSVYDLKVVHSSPSVNPCANGINVIRLLDLLTINTEGFQHVR